MVEFAGAQKDIFATGIDVTKPFPFLLAGVPAEVRWHIIVDLTEGKPITRELFAKSKVNCVAKSQPTDTRKAPDGLYLMIAEQEKKFRQNPMGAASDIVQKVFGALR